MQSHTIYTKKINKFILFFCIYCNTIACYLSNNVVHVFMLNTRSLAGIYLLNAPTLNKIIWINRILSLQSTSHEDLHSKTLGPVSITNYTFCREVSWNIEATRFVFTVSWQVIIVSRPRYTSLTFPYYWTFLKGILHRSSVDSPRKWPVVWIFDTFFAVGMLSVSGGNSDQYIP